MAKIKNRSYITIAFIFTLLIGFIQCQDNESNNIPLVEVFIDININDPAYINLKNVGGWEYITGGSRGLIVYRISQDQFNVFDRHCTFQPSNTCALVSVDATNFTASDQCCGSSFLLENGSVSRPPATLPLKSYNTSFDGTTLSIRN